jgi:hypothetical protein
MTISRKNPYGPIDAGALREFEATLPALLPSDFRSFLTEFNGAEFPDSPEFDDIPGGTALAEIFGLHDGPNYLRLDRMYVQMAPYVGPDMLVFAADPYGNYFGLALVGDDRATVYFIDHENLDASRADLPHVARSFEELVERAGGPEVACSRAPEDVGSAIRERDRDALKVLIASGESTRGHVHRAVASGDNEVLRIVLEAGGDADERGAINGTETPLFVAARQGRADMAELLLKHGADPNAQCSVGGTPIEMAVPFPDVLRIVAVAGAKPTKPSIAEAVRRVLRR